MNNARRTTTTRVSDADMVATPGSLPDRATLEAAFAGAVGSTRIEGREPSPFTHAQIERVIAGEMTFDEAVAALTKCYHQ